MALHIRFVLNAATCLKRNSYILCTALDKQLEAAAPKPRERSPGEEQRGKTQYCNCHETMCSFICVKQFPHAVCSTSGTDA